MLSINRTRAISTRKVRFVQDEDGVRYIVAPLVMLKPQVLSGNRGPLFYPRDEIARSVHSWDGKPLLLGHPVDKLSGRHRWASEPGVYQELGLGRLRNTRMDSKGRLLAEGWFDYDRVRRLHKPLLHALRSGVPIHVSTGLGTENEAAPPGSHHQGTPYDAIARNYKPDHLAVLMDGTYGACSVAQGCGLNLNNRRNPTMNQHKCSCNTHNNHNPLSDADDIPLGVTPSCFNDSTPQPVGYLSLTANDLNDAIDHSRRAVRAAKGKRHEDDSREAHEQTMSAFEEPSEWNHYYASELHQMAGEFHAKASNNEAAGYHAQAAAAHRQLAHSSDVDASGGIGSRSHELDEMSEDERIIHDLERYSEPGLFDASGDAAGYDTTPLGRRGQSPLGNAGPDAMLQPNVRLDDMLAGSAHPTLSSAFTGTGYGDMLADHEEKAIKAAGNGNHTAAAHHFKKISELHSSLASRAAGQGMGRLRQHHIECMARASKSADYHKNTAPMSPSFEDLEDVTGNIWTDEARSAAEEVRAAHKKAASHANAAMNASDAARELSGGGYDTRSKASKAALAATRKAGKEGRATPHNEAARLHEEAAQHHSTMGEVFANGDSRQRKMAGFHNAAAESHLQAADAHYKAVMATIHNSSTVMGDLRFAANDSLLDSMFNPLPCLAYNSERVGGDPDDDMLAMPPMDWSRAAERR